MLQDSQPIRTHGLELDTMAKLMDRPLSESYARLIQPYLSVGMQLAKLAYPVRRSGLLVELESALASKETRWLV